MQLRLSQSFIVFALAIVGFGSSPQAHAAWPPATERSIVVVGNCVSIEQDAGAAGIVAGIAEKLLGTAIDVGLTALFGAIRKAGEDKSTSDFMVGTTDLSKANGQCLIALRGSVRDVRNADAGAPDGDDNESDPDNEAALLARIRDGLRADHELSVERLDFFWESSIHFDPGRTAFRLATRTLIVSAVLDPRRLTDAGPSLVMTVAFTPAGVTDVTASTISQAEAFANQNMGRVHPGSEKQGRGPFVAHYLNARTAPTTPWLSLPRLEEGGKNIFAPRTVWVVRTETSDGNRFMKLLSSILEPNKDAIKAAVTSAALPSSRAQAAATAEQASRTKYYEAMRAYADAETKVSACAKAREDQVPSGERILACTAARQAQDVANTAAVAAALAAFYAPEKLIDPTA